MRSRRSGAWQLGWRHSQFGSLCVAGISLIQTCARLALVCLPLTPFPSSSFPSLFFTYSPLFATFHFNSLSHRISLITRVLSAASTSSCPLSLSYPLSSSPRPSGNTFPATPDMSEADDDVLLGCAIRFQLQLRHIAFLLRLLCHLMRRLFLPLVPLPPCLPPLSLPLPSLLFLSCIVCAFCFVLCLSLLFRFQF